MFWRWFLGARPAFEAMEQQSGYDLSPLNLHAPANSADFFEPVPVQQVPMPADDVLCTDYCFTLPASGKKS